MEQLSDDSFFVTFADDEDEEDTLSIAERLLAADLPGMDLPAQGKGFGARLNPCVHNLTTQYKAKYDCRVFKKHIIMSSGDFGVHFAWLQNFDEAANAQS